MIIYYLNTQKLNEYIIIPFNYSNYFSSNQSSVWLEFFCLVDTVISKLNVLIIYLFFTIIIFILQ